VEIIGKHLNKVDTKFITLEDFTFDENDIRKELEGRRHEEYEMKETITFLKCRLMEAFNTIKAIKAENEAL